MQLIAQALPPIRVAALVWDEPAVLIDLLTSVVVAAGGVVVPAAISDDVAEVDRAQASGLHGLGLGEQVGG